MKMICFKQLYKLLTIIACILLLVGSAFATTYQVSTKATLISKMNGAKPGDTVIVLNGTYNWGQIVFNNTQGTSTSAWIVLKAQTFSGVIFTGQTYIQFSGKHILLNGFRFANGNSGANDVIQFRSNSSLFAHYCRVTNITIDNYNSDSTGSYMNNGSKNGGDTLNRWVSLYGTHNRVDHCSFLNKFNGSPVIVIWYDSSNYPARGTSTFHLIDSNYFSKRGYLGSNEGEVIRVGTSTNSRTDGYNVIEYNLFEDGVQLDPEIISNKSNFNTYRYNTFRNHAGGITMRHGRYCNVYGNFFIRDNSASSTTGYGIRVIDKGHKVFNNYIEGLVGNNNSLTAFRAPIILFNGITNSNDTANPAFASKYFPADSTLIAFNTIVNCNGGAGIVLGYNTDSIAPFQPKGIIVANNLIKMTKGQAAIVDTSIHTDSVTYMAEGNIYKTTKGLGLVSSKGFTTKTLTFGTRANGILPPPSLVKDSARNTNNYVIALMGLDGLGVKRSNIYDVGMQETNGTGSIVSYLLDTSKVGAGKPNIILPVRLISFLVNKRTDNSFGINWEVGSETDMLEYGIELSNDGINFNSIGTVLASQKSVYTYIYTGSISPKNYFRLKMIQKDGTVSYSSISEINSREQIAVTLYPNPAKDNLNVRLSNYPSTYNVEIVDAVGNIIWRRDNLNKKDLSIGTSHLSNGSYYLQIKGKNNSINSYPFIVTK